MLEQIRTVDGETLLPLPADVLAAIGLPTGRPGRGHGSGPISSCAAAVC